MGYVKSLFLAMVICLTATVVWAGESLNDPGAPGSNASKMYTLENIYQRLSDNTQASNPQTGSFTEPGSGPAVTGRTLNQVYEKAIPTQVPKTGQTTSYATGDDGDLEKGVSWPSLRFTDNGNGTVTDNLTGLMWLKNANNAGSTKTWANALTYCSDLVDSSYNDWRLPNLKELQSLIDYGRSSPALPSGHPFTGVQSNFYWTSSTYANVTGYAWYVHLGLGYVYYASKTATNYVWPVRGGQ